MDKTVRLWVPVEFGGAVVTELTLRPPVGRDIRSFKISQLADLDLDGLLNLAGKLAGKPPEFMDMLDARDVFALCAAANDFFVGKE